MMDEEDRKSKVQAGKEALLAYQKKKVKRRKKKANTSNSSELLSSSLGVVDADSSGATLPLSGNVSPIPFDDTGPNISTISAGDSVAHTAALAPQLLSDNPSLAEHPLEECAVHAPTTFENDSGLGSAGPRPRVEPSEMLDGIAHRHSSPVQPDSSNVANLEQQLKASQEMQQQLQYELNSLRENQFGAIEGAKREVTTNYESQLAALQQTLAQMEQRCIALENHLSETKTSHRAEIENLLRQQEMAMQERDQKHAAHIVRLTTELTNQQEISGVVGGDSDEHEAERLRMIKEKMKEMHEEEKKQVAAEHEREKVKIREECQQQMELRRQQMEQLANTKIQELHAQFMSAHQTVLDQKNSAEATVTHWRNQVEEVQQQLDAIKLEKSSADTKYQSTIEAHCAEMELANQHSQDLEKHLIEWREKAATLEARLEKINLQRASDIDEMQLQNQEAMQQTVADFEEKLKAQKSLVEEYQARVQFFESSQQATIDEIEHRHLQDIDELKAKHSSEVSLLEESISDSSGDRASLEVAEAHMKSLQSQLDAYRTQESNFQGKLERLEQQHREDIELLKQQLEAQNLEEVDQVSAKFAAQIESLEEELTKLQSLVEEGHSPSTDQEVIKTMEAKHQKEILELQTMLRNSHELELTNLRKELELSNSTALEALQQQHENTVSTIRKELDTEWVARLTKAEKKVRDEAEHAKQAELERLKSEHKVALEKLQQSLAQTEERATAKTEACVTGLEAELHALRDEQSEWLQSRQDLLSQLEFTQRQLQETSQHLSHRNSEKLQLEEQCQQYQNEMKSVEVDLNIARNTSEQDKLALAEAQEQVEHWRAKASEFQGEIDRLDEVERVTAEQSHKVIELTDNIAQKNMTIADLQAQNDTLNTEVFSLTQKCQQQIASAEMLQKQLESTGNADEQISSLQQQLSELIPIKEGYSRVQERAQSMESQLHAKDKELAMVRSQLEQMAQQVAETGEQWTARCEELTASSARETEALRKEIANHRVQESELRQQLNQYQQQIDTLKPKEQENAQTITDLNHTIQDLSGKLGSAESEIKQLREEKHKLEQDLKDSQGILDELAGDEHDTELSKNYERLQQDFETSRAEKIQLAAELAKLQKEHQQVLQEQTKSWENKLQEQEQLIQDLQAQLSAKESAFTEIQNEFGRQLTEVEMRESSLLKTVRDSTKAQEQLGTVLGEKSALEEVLSKARQNLTDKLQEKESLERELGFHRTELERRLAEKHRLEELLFEKSRFEQELQSQKDQLQKELKGIESKLKLKELELEQQQQQHSSDLSQLQEDLVTRHSTELAQLSEGLNHQHDVHISALTEDHRRQLTDVETNLRWKHNEAVHLLEAKHKKELEGVREQLHASQEEQLRKFKEELDERRKKEVNTVREVLEREKQADMAEVEAALRAEEKTKLHELELELKQYYQKKYEEEMAAERERLEQTHKLHIDALTAGISEDSQQQFQLRLEHVQETHKQELQNLVSHYETILNEKTVAGEENAKLEAGKQLQKVREEFEEELRGKLAQREQEISAAYEEKVTQLNAEWEEKMATSLETCRSELSSLHQCDVERLKLQHSEEVQNALKACQKAFEEQIEAMKAKHKQELARSMAECEETLGKQHAEQMEMILSDHESKRKAEVEELKVQVEELQEAQCDLQTQEQQYRERVSALEAQVKELEDTNQRLHDEHREQIEYLTAEKETSLESLVQQHKIELEELSTGRETHESALRSEYESQITFLKERCESLEEREGLDSASALADLRQQWEKEKLTRESGFQEEIAQLQTRCEQKLHEAQLEHIHQINALTEKSERRQTELELQHEQRYQALVHTHEQEKRELLEKHEAELQDLYLTQSKRLLTLKAEVQEASDAANESLTKQLEAELQVQRERLEKQHECDLKLQKSKLRSEFSLESDKMRTELDEKYTEMLAEVHAEVALRNAVQLEELEQKLGSDKERALAEQQATLEMLQQRLTNIAGEHQHMLEAQRQELQSQYEDRLGELESALEGERKKQITLLREQYDQEWTEREPTLRSQLEKEHVQQMEELLARCTQEKTQALEDLRKEMSEEVQRLKSELTVLREQNEQEVKSAEARVGEEVRKHLVEEYMGKFREVTEKLQQVHQSELSALQQEKLLSETRHSEELDRLREEVEERHQHDISQIMQSHKHELTGLQELYEAKLRQAESEHAVRVSEFQRQFETLQSSEQQGMEATVRLELSKLNHELESKLSQLEQERTKFKHREAALEQQVREAGEREKKWRGKVEEREREVTTLQQQCVDLGTTLQAREGELTQLTERHQQLQDNLAASERRLVELEEHHTARLQSVEEDLVQKIHQAEVDLQSAVAESEGYKKSQEELKTENARVLSSLQQQVDLNEQLSEENTRLREQVSRVKGHLDMAHSQADREHQEDSNTLTILRDEMRGLEAERDVLQSTVVALQSAVTSSLQLTPIITSVLTGQQPQPGIGSRAEAGGTGLPERLLETTQPPQGEELTPPGTASKGEEGEGGSSAEEPTPTHSTSPPVLPVRFSTDWTTLKMTPSEDSGLASQQTSIVRSEGTLVDRSTSRIPITPPTPTPHPIFHASHTFPLAPLMPAVSEHDLSSSSATPLADASHLHPGIPPVLSVSLMSAANTTLHPHPQQLQQASYPKGDTAATEDLSIVPLDSTLLSTSQMAAPEEPSGSVVDLATLQDGLSKFHDTVCSLVQSYVTMAARASESQQELHQAREQLAYLSSQLAELEQSRDELRTLVVRRKGEMAETKEQLMAAEAKMQSLVEQLEGDRLENEIVEEMQNLVEKFKVKEASELALREQLAEMEKLLQDKQLENEGLGHQLAQLSRASEDLQKQSGALESELEETQRSLTGAQQECEALREANRDLRTLQEKFETVLRSKEEEVNQVRSEFSQRLESTQGEIRELEDMRNQLAAKEEIEENLVLERDGLAARLSAAEHQLATYQLLPSMEEQESKIRQMTEREDKLTRELKEQVGLCETLKAKLEEAQVVLNETGQESARVKAARAQLQVEVRTLHDELQRKEVSLQNALMEKLSHERDLQSAHEELATLREQLDEASAERESAEAQRQEEEREEVDADERATEVERLTEEKALLTQQVTSLQSELQSYHKSSVSRQQECESLRSQLVEREREGEEASVVRTQLENRVAGLTEQLREREEDTRMQVEALEQELTTVRAELTRQCAEVELMRSEGERRRGQLQAEVQQLQHTSAQLEKEKSLLLERLQQSTATLDQVKVAHSQEIATLQAEVEETRREAAEHEATLHQLNTEHAQKLSDLHVSHLEAFHHQQEQLEAQHAGELSYLRLHHRQQLDHLRAEHEKEVSRIVSEHQQLLTSMGTGVLGETWVDGEESNGESMLMRIAELAPLLAQEAGEVKDLCNMTGQFLPESPLPSVPGSASLSPHKESLHAVLASLRQLLEEIRATKGDGSGVEDWRGELLQAVERILDHEHSLLASAVRGREEEEEEEEGGENKLLRQKLSDNPTLLHQLHSADRASLLGEIKQLHGRLEDVSREQQKEHSTAIQLRASLDAVQTHSSQLEAELSTRQDQLLELQKEKLELDSVAHSLRCTIEGLQSELEEAQGSLGDLEESMRRATSTITSLQQELQASCAREADLQRVLSETKASSQLQQEQLHQEHEHVTQLEKTLRCAKEDQRRLAREREEEGRRHEELQQLLHQQLNKSTLLKSALDREVSGKMDLRQMVEQLLKQERLQAIAQESLQMERDQLDREVRRLHRDVKEWKELAQARAAGSPGKALPASSSSFLVQQQQAVTITNLQGEKAQLRSTLSRLQGQISDLEEEKSQNKELRDAQVELHQELEKKREEVGQLHERVAQLQEQLARAQERVAAASSAGPALSVEGAAPQDAIEAKLAHLYGQYRQAEVHRKALVFQKHYLQCQVDAFYQTQQAALMMMADMGAPVDSGPKVPHSKFPRPYARFRAIGCVVVATLRFQYVRRKKLQYLKSRVSKLRRQMSGRAEDIHNKDLSSRGNVAQSHSQHSTVGLSHGIQTALSGISLASQASPSFPLFTSDSHLSSRTSQTSSKPRLVSSQQHTKTLTNRQGSYSMSSKSQGVQSVPSKAPPLLLPSSHSSSGTIKSPKGRGDDPHLAAYIQGLERLQARLGKTKL